MKRNLPDTSHAANKAATLEMRQGHYKKIIDALSKLGVANYEKIADYIGLDRHAVGRRVSEMEGLQLIYKPGTKSFTKSHRQAYDYCLTGQGMPKTDNEVKYSKHETSAAQHASALLNLTNKQLKLL